ncbi:hypothetical protein CTI12_AA564330 [Artemisia annua]|uniref:Uncharacterized protein n=1 Tax=Artemisia annua TaxID=35608 RepID=A0A2U1KU01_ARTAN|nr:hypothetical protein CTI12_AA564330 [Artemisia annua]
MGTEHEVQEFIRIFVEGESKKLSHSKQSNVTICQVPESLRSLNPTDYTPRIISIGPLHKEDIRLKAMEEHKVAYMYKLFCRTMEATNRDTDQTARNCLQAVLGLVTRARACYAPSFTEISDFKLAEMMVIDGCFILELLYKYQCGIAEGDPIFDNILVMHDVKYDLLLLENQIPFFILQTLFNITFKRISQSVTVIDLVLYFFKDMNILNNNNELTIKDYEEQHCHILGLLQSCYRPKNTNSGPSPNHLIFCHRNRWSRSQIQGAKGWRFCTSLQ